jgi:hypothetical protein
MLLAPMALGGCGQSSRGTGTGATASASASAPAKPKGMPGIQVQLNRYDLPIHSLLVYSRGGSSLQLALSTHPLGCEQLKSAGTVREVGEVAFDLTVAPALLADGQEKWTVTRVNLGRVTKQGKLGSAEVKVFDPRRTVKLALEESISFPKNPTVGLKKDKHLDLKAKIDQPGCGLRPYDPAANVRPQRKLELKLADKVIPVNGASVRLLPDGKRRLLLTSEPHSCKSGPQGSDYSVSITQDGESGKVESIRVEGYALTRTLAQRFEDDSMSAAWAGSLDAGTEIEVELNGLSEIAGYRLSLQGTASAMRCDR